MVSKAESILNHFVGLAATRTARILFPEAALDLRVIQAAQRVSEMGFAHSVLVGDRRKISVLWNSIGAGSEEFEILDPNDDLALLDSIALEYQDRRSKENLTYESARSQVSDPLYFAAMLVARDAGQGLVAGAATTTADVLRASIKCVGLQPGAELVSSHFIMVLPDSNLAEDGVVLFGDSAVVIEPDAREAAQIAIATADMGKRLLGLEPRIAMLSFSTKGSAQTASVVKMREAAGIVNELRPDLQCDGELQADSALLSAIGEKKAPGSTVAGRANILIFPNLDAGNICYKLVERIAGARAVGPVIQGLNKPVNDLSRGCSVEDIVNVTAITAAKAATQ